MLYAPILDSSVICSDELGMESYDIPDENVKASSTYSSTFPPRDGRLNVPNKAWFAGQQESEPWIQANIGYQTHVSSVATQGYAGNYVKTFKVSTFLSSLDDEEEFVKEASEVKVLNEKLNV